MLAHIANMVEEAQGTKAPIERFADTVSAVFVPVVLIMAVTSFAFWLVFGRYLLGGNESLAFAIQSFLGVLVIACPCALGLATPTAIIAGVGRGAKQGILVKDAQSLELLHTITTVVIDKTGTLTQGEPVVVGIYPSDFFASHTSTDHDGKGLSAENRLLLIAASLEQGSEHPIARAILHRAREMQLPLQGAPEGFRMHRGKGIIASVAGKEYRIGTQSFLEEAGIRNISIPQQAVDDGTTLFFVSDKTAYLGSISVLDVPKANAKNAVSHLTSMGIEVILATGDRAPAAAAVSKRVGISRFHASMLPEEKLTLITSLQREGKRVAMVGDGVNDTPALAASDVGIALATGSDSALSTAQITLLAGDISKVARAIELSKTTMRIVKQNLFWAFFYNALGIPVAAGILYPVFGIHISPALAGAAMAFSSVSVVTNSLRLARVGNHLWGNRKQEVV